MTATDQRLYTDADVERYAQAIVGIPGMEPHPDDLAAVRAALDGLAQDGRLLRADEDRDEMLADLADLAQAQAVIDATRQMVIDANARLRAQLLAALDREDDDRTPLSTYVSHLVAQRDALKWSVGKAADEEEQLRTDMAFAREETKSIYDTCKQIERERDTMREVAQGARQAYELKVQDLACETARLGKLVDVLAAHGHSADDTSRRCLACSICRALREVTGQEAPSA